MIDTVDFPDICICVFPFTSGQAAKARPALVLRDLGQDCLVARITSVSHHGFLDMAIRDWRAAGLEKPSTLRLSRLVTVEKTIIRVRIGRLTAEDANRALRDELAVALACPIAGRQRLPDRELLAPG